ncbi:MAG: multidrug effflux MFS transporter [Rhodobacteraceae bacterium]|nr:multidrug effflux MFS transporter [Paracoccaceae bacterium]
MSAQDAPLTPVRRLPQGEFVALLAVLFAMTAFSIDAMLPAMPDIAAELSPDVPNRAQFIITSFVFGMGAGTFLTGPLSDALGRKAVILGGVVLYCFGAVLAWAAPSLPLMLAARALQGLGVAGPRVAGMALVRDLYSGRQMARIVSFVMMIFVLIPAVAPLFGSFVIAGFGWRGIFAAFILFALVTSTWFSLRQPETLPKAARRPLRAGTLLAATSEILGNRLVVMVIAVLTLGFASLFAMISSTQQVFDLHFGLAESFPYWFAFIALVSGLGSILNARLVVRLGMRRMISAAYLFQTANSALILILFGLGLVPAGIEFWVYLYWTISVFFMTGLTIGNLNALALEPMGHIAGTAASFITALATVLSVVLAAPIGLAFDGTPVPLMIGVFLCCLGATALVFNLPPAER